MKAHTSPLAWLGLGLAAVYWLAESLLHSFVFGDAPLSLTLAGEHDPNEIWMRGLIAVMFVLFGWIADRSIRAESRLKDDALRINRLLRFLGQVKHNFQYPVEDYPSDSLPEGFGRDSGAASPVSATRGGGAAELDEPVPGTDDIARLARFLRELSSFVDLRFKELYVLLQLTEQINLGLLLDEVLEKAYQTLQAVLPYDRLSVAFIENDGRLACARWVRSDNPDMTVLRAGYCATLQGSSLQRIIASGEPRIINDLAAHLRAHPQSESTQMMLAEGIRSSLTCPLFSAGRPIGFMFFSSRAANSYKTVHVEIFRLIAGHLSVVVEKSNLYQQVLEEKRRSESLLLNVMPARIAAHLRAGKQAPAESLPEVNILFADIVDFTRFASRFPPERVLDLLQNIFVPFDRLCDLYGVEKIKTIGDQYMAMTGASTAADGGTLRGLADFALDALRIVETMRYPDGTPVQIRIGMHRGPAVAGIVGQKKFAYDIWGDAVNVASRMESSAETGRIHVTEEIHSRLLKDFCFERRDCVEIKGKGSMKTYYLVARKESPRCAGSGGQLPPSAESLG